jgi:hypothetical protein
VLWVCKGKRLIFMAVIVQVVSSGLWRRAEVAVFSETFVLHYAVSQTIKPQLGGEEQCSSSTTCRVKGHVMTAQSVG